MKYIYVLDYESVGLYEVLLSKEDEEYIDEEWAYSKIDNVLDEYGLKGSECNYMISDEKLYLETINKIKC